MIFKHYILTLAFIFVLQLPVICDNYFETETKCGTFAGNEEQKKFNSRILIPIDTIVGRPTLQKNSQSPSGFFLVHYDTSGFHAVNLTDNNGNGIPDYVDSTAYYFDYCFNIEVNEMKYNAPFEDGMLGGTAAYDIYLMNIGDGEPAYYGVTRKDDEKLPRNHFPRWVSHIIIDNDYSPFDSTSDSFGEKKQTFGVFGSDGLKITVAHELHHAIQLTYGMQEMPISHTLYEMSSTWMEYRIFPEIKDYIQYVKRFFTFPDKFPFGVGIAENGYRWSIFCQYIYKKYADSLLLRMWENVGEGFNAYAALDESFLEKGSSLKNEFCNFLPWLYYTGERTQESKYFNDALLFPEFNFYKIDSFISPAFIAEGIMQSFEVRAFRCNIPSQPENSLDTLDIFLANTDLQSATKQFPSDKPYSIICTNVSNPDCQQIEGTSFYYGLKAEKGEICDKTFFSISNPINFAYPNPFRTKEDKIFNIPIRSNAILYNKAHVIIYSSDMVEQFSGDMSIVINKPETNPERNDRVIQIESEKFSNCQSGVYIYSVDYKGEIFFGKFVLIN